MLMFIFLLPAVGQQTHLHQNKHKNHQDNLFKQTVQRYEDSLRVALTEKDSVSAKPALPDNPYLYKMFTTPIYYFSPIKRAFGLQNATDSLSAFGDDSTFVSMDRTLLNAYIANASVFKYTEQNINDIGKLRPDVVKEIPQSPQLISQKTTKFDVDQMEKEDMQIITHKPNFWKFSGSYSLQLMQNYVSDNWYQGGESNHSLMATANISAVYNNKQKLKFENYLVMKLGFQYYKSDKVHRYRTTSDQLRLTNKLGLQAFKKWYYTLLLQSWTQFYPGYKKNNKKVYSDFMSPFESVFSIGMEYKLNVKNFTLSANISPYACDFKYVDRLALSTSFGLKANRHTKFDHGSNMTINSTWKFLKNVSWSARIYYYTNYESSRFEWENTYTFTINKYLSTKLFLYPRFDDSVYKKDESYLQFKEWMSLGLNVSF